MESTPGNNPGGAEKQAMKSVVDSALDSRNAVANEPITGSDKFHSGPSKMIDGAVDSRNASV
jgi:hypothetical protein